MPKFLIPLVAIIAMSCQPVFAAIYGADNRQDIYQVPHLRATAKAVAVAVPKHYLTEKDNGRIEVEDVESLANSSEIFACTDEKFSNQPVIGNCTAFLVSPQHIMTAAHCFIASGVVHDQEHALCESFRWIFDYNAKGKNKVNYSNIDPDKVYGCKRVVHAENINSVNDPIFGLIDGNDFALIELDRPVVGIKPLKLANQRVKKNSRVYTIGHPSGLPAKFSGYSPVLNSNYPHFFSSNLDTLGGNSGGPVFNTKNQVVGILVSGHPFDYFDDPNGCSRVNRCDSQGNKCNWTSRDQKSNYIQQIDTVFPYLFEDIPLG